MFNIVREVIILTRRFKNSVADFPGWEDRLAAYAGSMGIQLDSGMIDGFRSYAILLQKWGRRMNLTSRLEPEEIISLHFLDSLSLLAFYSPEKRSSLADIGTGAGFPGLPLKIARPDLMVTLIESSIRKSEFCKTVVDKLGLKDVFVVRARAGARQGFPSQRLHDLVVSRAVASLPVLFSLADGLLRPGGTFAAYKGPGDRISKDPSGAMPAGWKGTGEFVIEVPGRVAPRAILLFELGGGAPAPGQ